MSKKALTIIVVVIVVAVAAGFAIGHKSSTHAPAASAPAASNNSSQPAAGAVTIRNMMFTPSQISVQKGATVTWTNNDTTSHTVVDDLSNVDGPSSGSIAPGATYSFTFNKTGSFQYHCSIHPSMRGTIVVK